MPDLVRRVSCQSCGQSKRQINAGFPVNKPSSNSRCLSMISGQTLRVCPEGKPVSTFPDHALTLHHILRTRRASSVILSGVHAGSQTRLTLTRQTPGTLATAFATICGNSHAAGNV